MHHHIFYRICIGVLLIGSTSPLFPAKIGELYRQHCAACHGPNGEGGLGGSLVKDTWKYGDTDEDKARVIREGLPELGMQPYKDILSEEEIRAMVIYMRELETRANQQPPPKRVQGAISTRHLAYRMETLVENDREMWGVSFLPDGRFVVTEFQGALRIVEPDGALNPPVDGTPDVVQKGQGGLMDVAVHPGYSENGWIYLAFTEGSPDQCATTVVRGRIRDNRWVDQETVFRADPRFRSASGRHFGTRIVFKDGDVYFALGDRGRRNQAQDPGHVNGKIHRVREDGSVPPDNPFAESGLDTVWSIGHRNPQALAFRPGTDELWSTEHGPRGGDELNRIRRGLNYGWPKVTHGMNYNGTPITEHTRLPGLEPPVLHWTPSIAVCGMAFVDGEVYPEWDGDLLVGGLRAQVLERLRLRDGEVAEREVVMKNQGRVRDVKTGPDGFVYVILEGNGSRLVRLRPAGKQP